MWILPPGLRPPTTAEWRLEDNVQSSPSPLSGYAPTTELPGATWRLKMQWDLVEADELRLMNQFLRLMRGRAGRCFIPPPDAHEPSVAVVGAPAVGAGAAARSRTLVTAGWPAGAAALRAGDYFAFDAMEGRELKQVTVDAWADQSGVATLRFDPPIRRAPVAGAALLLRPATAQMRLISVPMIAFEPPMLGTVTMEFAEAFGPTAMPANVVMCGSGMPLFDHAADFVLG